MASAIQQTGLDKGFLTLGCVPCACPDPSPRSPRPWPPRRNVIATAISEVARNIVAYAKVGEIQLRIVIVESVTGLTVPSAALLSKADGSIVVIDSEGIEYPVTVVTSARGLSIIEGVDAGTRVRVPATEG